MLNEMKFVVANEGRCKKDCCNKTLAELWGDFNRKYPIASLESIEDMLNHKEPTVFIVQKIKYLVQEQISSVIMDAETISKLDEEYLNKVLIRMKGNQ